MHRRRPDSNFDVCILDSKHESWLLQLGSKQNFMFSVGIGRDDVVNSWVTAGCCGWPLPTREPAAAAFGSIKGGIAKVNWNRTRGRPRTLTLAMPTMVRKKYMTRPLMSGLKTGLC